MERQPRLLLDQRTREPGSVSCDGGWNQWLPHALTRPCLGLCSYFPMHIRGYTGTGLDDGNLVRWTQIAIAISDKPYPGVWEPAAQRQRCQKTKASDGSSTAQIQDWLTAAKTAASLHPKHEEVYMLTLRLTGANQRPSAFLSDHRQIPTIPTTS